MKSKLYKMSWISLAAVLLAFLVGATGYSVHASSKQKQSEKLVKKMSKAARTDFIDVIIKPTSTWTSGLTTDLNGKGALLKKSFSNFDFKVYKVKQKDINALANRSDVDFMTIDDTVKTLGHLTATTGADNIRTLMGSSMRLDGSGIGIVVVDSGINTAHYNLKNSSGNSRVVYSQDFTGENRTDDPYGHGTHVASTAAGNKLLAQGAYEGIASNANLINLRVLNKTGTGTISGILAALDWIYTNRKNASYNMRIVNLSLGANAIDAYSLDPLCIAVRKLVDAGIVVVAAAGNEGKDGEGKKIYGQIHSPGNEPSAITVGAVNTYGTNVRTDDVMATYSSRGPTRSFYTDASGVKHYDNLIKPDLVAPGNKIISAYAYPNHLVTRNPSLDANTSGSHSRKQMYLSGTSMATPAVAGTAALMLQANPKLTPNMVKTLLMYTAQTMRGANTFEQGAGQLNVDGAVRLAKIVRQDLTASTAVGSPLLTTTAPAPQSSFNSETFGWGQGVIMDHTFATGSNLITKYQGIYKLGVLIGDGTIESNGVLISDGVLMSDGVLISDNILTGNGVLIADGYPFLSCGVLLGDGVLLSDGVLITDGVLLGDGVLVGDGVLITDNVMATGIASQSSNALTGDATAMMPAEPDESPDDSPVDLTANTMSNSHVNLTWNESINNETGFIVERCTGEICMDFAEVAVVGNGIKTYSNTNLTANTTYRYRVRAYNASGYSFYTNIVAATTNR